MFQKKKKKKCVMKNIKYIFFSHKSSSEVRIRNWNMLPESITLDIRQVYEVDLYRSNKE